MTHRRSLDTPETRDTREIYSLAEEESRLLRGVLIGMLIGLPLWGILLWAAPTLFRGFVS